MFCQDSDSALSSSCFGADFRGTRVWNCSQLNSWASIERREREGGGEGGGALISNIAYEGELNRGRALIRENTVYISTTPVEGHRGIRFTA